MAPQIAVAVGAVSAGLGILLWLAFSGADPVRRGAVSNLQRGMRQAPATAAEVLAVENVRAREKTGLAIRLTPPSLVRRLDRLHGKAGRPPAWTVARLCAAKILLVLFVVPIGLLFVTASPSAITLVIALLAAALAYFLPELLLHSEGQKRSQAIALELADTLDQMSIAVEAGLGFESAMAQVARNGNGPLAQELVRTLQDMQVGQTRRQAYEALGQRSDVRDLRRFISAVIQADAYGIAIADVLRTQAGEMRLKRRQRAEEKAMKIPVKVIFPLLFCILPTLFIVLLGPAAIGIIGAFA